ncbi:MAG TPA: hypothetical protein VND54_01450 [Candidatus Saccharimonadales bacterium]|nr:hypothetical protein [Candidatus Saccharimonadales bacterium]
MHPLLRPTSVVIAVLGAAVVGLGTVVAVDHATTAAPRAGTVSLSAASTAASSLLASGGFAPTGQLKGEASRIFDFFTADTKLTWQQIGNDLLRGETLDEIAGVHASKVRADALTEVRAGLSLGIVRGAITQAQATRLVGDAQDAISVLMAAKLSALLPAGR